MKTVRMVPIALFMIVGMIAVPCGVHAEVIDKIIVVVNGEMISQGEVDRMLAPVYFQYRNIYTGSELAAKLEEARQKIIEQLIEDRLILGEAKRLNVEVAEREIDARIDEISQRLGSEENFLRALDEQGVVLKDLRTRYREQMMKRKLIDQKIGSRVNITPIEIRTYYEKHPNEFVMPDEVKLRNILLRPKEKAPVDKTITLAKDILKKIREGGDFAALAKEYSEGPFAADGGLMGFVKKGELIPELEKVAFTLKEGEASDIIQTGLGYHILKVEERRIQQVKGLADAKQDIEEAIYREKVQSKLKDWVESLKKNAYIAFK